MVINTRIFISTLSIDHLEHRKEKAWSFTILFIFIVNDVESNHKVVLIVALVVSITVLSAMMAAGLLMIRARRKRAGKDTPADH
jgi:hypothetical protein